ncbi:MAG: cyclic nucleotide-binding domain-containing protein, partial [bacterium]|nr:cyclic nucleotide-binding domain-containing protein [bacterium]
NFIFKKGKARDKIIIIKNGLVALETEISETIALFKNGDALGEMALIAKNTSHLYNLRVASEELETWELSVYNWHSLIKKNHSLSDKIYKNIASILEDRLNHANNKLVTLISTGKTVSAYEDLGTIAKEIINSILKVIPSKKALFLTYSSATGKIHVYKNIAYSNLQENTYYSANKDKVLKVLIKNPATTFFSKDNLPKVFVESLYYSQNAIITPIHLKNKVLGFIILGDKLNNKAYSINNQILLEATASQVAPAIEELRRKKIASLEQEIKERYIDPFVGY